MNALFQYKLKNTLSLFMILNLKEQHKWEFKNWKWNDWTQERITNKRKQHFGNEAETETQKQINTTNNALREAQGEKKENFLN